MTIVSCYFYPMTPELELASAVANGHYKALCDVSFIRIDGIPRRFQIQMGTFSLIWIAILQKDYS